MAGNMTIENVHVVTHEMRGLANQVYILATGLQNAAPPGASLQSVQYLLETAAQLEQISQDAEKLLPIDSSKTA
jgi:hypothetical protein